MKGRERLVKLVKKLVENTIDEFLPPEGSDQYYGYSPDCDSTAFSLPKEHNNQFSSLSLEKEKLEQEM